MLPLAHCLKFASSFYYFWNDVNTSKVDSEPMISLYATLYQNVRVEGVQIEILIDICDIAPIHRILDIDALLLCKLISLN